MTKDIKQNYPAYKEEALRAWFGMWLTADRTGIAELFASDAVYIESWGPRYAGLKRICQWFDEWNCRGKVRVWDIKDFYHKGDRTVVEWYFACVMNDGSEDCFEGMTVAEWRDGKICYLREYGSNTDNYDPYAVSDEPVFKDEKIKWF